VLTLTLVEMQILRELSAQAQVAVAAAEAAEAAEVETNNDDYKRSNKI
jgi:hypothetical protein